ncbi:hypothetical protein KSC_000950 [Ktedonobacter sp. SOSP1-52]|uniref:hypothetical protein n=1 Tax=Ktedonobacter sp. SOSP1-52 TaxID=2778366 RepID=UPI001915AA83|nr:hypothetical protein KSC_000950 [Ktedonobacter sp. SOSP1-52]
MQRTFPWKVNDQFWEQVETLIPVASSHVRGGRPRMPGFEQDWRSFFVSLW